MHYSEEVLSNACLLGQMKWGMCMEMKACACLAGGPQQVHTQITVQQTGIHRNREIKIKRGSQAPTKRLQLIQLTDLLGWV